MRDGGVLPVFKRINGVTGNLIPLEMEPPGGYNCVFFY